MDKIENSIEEGIKIFTDNVIRDNIKELEDIIRNSLIPNLTKLIRERVLLEINYIKVLYADKRLSTIELTEIIKNRIKNNIKPD